MQKGRTQVLTALVALVVLATASACSGVGPIGSSAGGGSKAAAKPVITPRQARSVVMRIHRQHMQAFRTQDAAALASIETEPQLSLDEHYVQGAKDQGSTFISEYPYVSVTTLVPKQTSFPAWFMAVAKDSRGNEVLDLFNRRSSAAPWKLGVVTGVESGPIKSKEVRGGWSVAAELSTDPSQALSSYWNAATSGGSATGIAPGSMTSGVASQLNSNTAANERNGWAMALSFSAGGFLPQAVKLADGSVLGFAWVTALLKTRPSIAPCFPQPETNGSKWDPLVPDGNYQELQLSYTYLLGMSATAAGSLTGISYVEGTTGVSETPCTG